MKEYHPSFTNLVLLILVTVIAREFVVASDPLVTTPSGQIRGIVDVAENGRPYYAFLGIRYAKPPLGGLRFSPPVATSTWRGVFNATEDGSPCPQRDVFSNSSIVIGSEDCLFLNVYTPKLPNDEDHYPLPVVIWIHGGSWLWWSGMKTHFDPRRLVNKDLLLVGINYRLGWFGFLSTEDSVAPGNNGLKDQAAALRWVKENIAAFGGDPERITLAGQDTGAISAHLHTFSPLSKDYITGVISQSGSGFSPSAIAHPGESLRKARFLAESNDCPSSSSSAMLKCLRKLDTDRIVITDANLYDWKGHPTIPLRAVVEGAEDGAFLVEHPESTVEKGNQAKVPMMIGTVSDEGASTTAPFMFTPSSFLELNENYRRAFPPIFVYEEYFERGVQDRVSDAIKNRYFDEDQISVSKFSQLQQAVTTRLYKRPAQWTALKQRDNNTVYLYQLNYRGSLSFSRVMGAGFLDLGVCHGDDLLYTFDFRSLFGRSLGNTVEERMMIESITEYWYNFVATGNPTPEKTSLLSVIWEPVNKTSPELKTLYLNGPQNSTIMRRNEESANEDEDAFWESLPIAHNPDRNLYPALTESGWKAYLKRIYEKIKGFFGRR